MRLADRIVAEDAPVAGLAIADALSAITLFTLAHRLRERGFRGHITAGGPLATLARHDILRLHPPIDSVVRHAGELPMVHLADESPMASRGVIAPVSRRGRVMALHVRQPPSPS